jgi:hypothetical protein
MTESGYVYAWQIWRTTENTPHSLCLDWSFLSPITAEQKTLACPMMSPFHILM